MLPLKSLRTKTPRARKKRLVSCNELQINTKNISNKEDQTERKLSTTKLKINTALTQELVERFQVHRQSQCFKDT